MKRSSGCFQGKEDTLKYDLTKYHVDLEQQVSREGSVWLIEWVQYESTDFSLTTGNEMNNAPKNLWNYFFC